MVVVDESWTKNDLQQEAARRGLKHTSRLNKAALLRALQTGVVVPATSSKNGGGGSKDIAEMTVAELREACRQRGLKNTSKLKKDELIRLLRGEKGDTSSNGGSAKPPEPTLEELRAECRKRGITGYSKLNKKDLIRRMEDYKSQQGTNTTRALGERGKITRAVLGTGGKGRERRRQQKQQRARKSGPLRSRAQERFDAGPSPQDTPGFLYIYYEPGGDGGGVSNIKEWKIGKTILDPPERRMNQSAQNNRKVYKLRASWYVPWCGYVEKIVHLDLDDLQIVPGKEKKWGGGGREDGGTEWFRTDIEVIEARVKLVIRMVAAREAGEADALGAPAFCGMFRCGLPKLR